MLTLLSEDPTKVFTNDGWPNDGEPTVKTPTSILFDRSQKFHSFGYDAETKYAELAANADEEDSGTKETHHEWFLFRRFKMSLFKAFSREHIPKRKRKIISDDMIIEAENGKTMLAMTVFSEAIRYLKTHLDKSVSNILEQKGMFGKSTQKNSWADDIRWVLTVPAIWLNEAKQFMRKAAELAGIKGDQLILALEPEAAATLCKHLPLHTDGGLEIKPYQPGKKISDGGTVDITAYSIARDHSLQEIHSASGDAIGGTNVDRLFFKLLNDIFGQEAILQFKKESKSDWLGLERNFEAKKKVVGNVDSVLEECTFSHVSPLFECVTEQTFKKNLEKHKLQDVIKKLKGNKLRINSSFLRERILKEPINAIIHHIEELLKSESLIGVETIVLVGGFAGCSMLMNSMKKSFKQNIIKPPEANLAVMKGAVLFGHSPQSISQRLSPRYYGIASNEIFVPGKHREYLKVKNVDTDICTDIFKCILERNCPLGIVKHIVTPPSAYATEANVEVYEAEEYVEYCNDPGCQMIGQIVFPFDSSSNADKRPFHVDMDFSFTEVTVTITDPVTGEKMTGNFECLKKK